MIFSSTTCADHRAGRRFCGTFVGLLFAASGCSVVAPHVETPAPAPAPAPVPVASVDPYAALGPTASAPLRHPDDEEETQTDTTPVDRP
jgi:hypothetical protein